ncbi:hypothetical protein BCR44DRAFT_1439534 [Catenaria anguillulae PL171]|uniref:Uncharacterized protein n=1 Tax=Catenaria anguillulae PL171 TaxID=765915 RepID=A0A1Y2HFG8_9FUNG|nr:hypothetical protein BCR44DRAFT_1439534 [Catenaria anguillulae PL171]
MASFLGYKLYPTAMFRPFKMFAVGGVITWGLLYKAREGMLAAQAANPPAPKGHH